jgi:hypothetical protein
VYGAPQFVGARARGGTYYLGTPLSRRRRGALAALTPDRCAEQIFPAAQVRSGAGHNAAVRNLMVQAAAAGSMLNSQGQPAYIPGTADCAGAAGSVKGPVMTTIGGTAIKIAAATGPGAPFVFAAGVVLDVVGFIGGIFTHHHQQAVAKERGTLCVEVPAANNALQAIDAAVQQGQMTPQQAQQGLDALVTNFRAGVGGIIHGSDPMSSGECNAACVMLSQLRAIVACRKSVYQDLAAQQATAAAASPGGSSTSPVAAVLAPVIAPIEAAVQSAGLPSWVVPAAGLLLLWKLF